MWLLCVFIVFLPFYFLSLRQRDGFEFLRVIMESSTRGDRSLKVFSVQRQTQPITGDQSAKIYRQLFPLSLSRV